MEGIEDNNHVEDKAGVASSASSIADPDSVTAADSIYREYLMDHYKNPRNMRSIDNPDIRKADENVSCGDKMEFFVKINDDVVSEISFLGKGCVISMASASMLTEHAIGKSVDELRSMNAEDVKSMIGLQLTPSRLKCAMLPLMTLKKGIIEKLGDSMDDADNG